MSSYWTVTRHARRPVRCILTAFRLGTNDGWRRQRRLHSTARFARLSIERHTLWCRANRASASLPIELGARPTAAFSEGQSGLDQRVTSRRRAFLGLLVVCVAFATTWGFGFPPAGAAPPGFPSCRSVLQASEVLVEIGQSTKLVQRDGFYVPKVHARACLYERSDAYGKHDALLRLIIVRLSDLPPGRGFITPATGDAQLLTIAGSPAKMEGTGSDCCEQIWVERTSRLGIYVYASLKGFTPPNSPQAVVMDIAGKVAARISPR
jgi:hypothetical protein